MLRLVAEEERLWEKKKRKQREALKNRRRNENCSRPLCPVASPHCVLGPATHLSSELYQPWFHRKFVWLQWNVGYWSEFEAFFAPSLGPIFLSSFSQRQTRVVSVLHMPSNQSVSHFMLRYKQVVNAGHLCFWPCDLPHHPGLRNNHRDFQRANRAGPEHRRGGRHSAGEDTPGDALRHRQPFSHPWEHYRGALYQFY